MGSRRIRQRTITWVAAGVFAVASVMLVISTMQVRGAPLIGATAAYGVALALRDDASDEALDRACETLATTRPTAINLRWALDEMQKAVRNQPRDKRVAAAFARAVNDWMRAEWLDRDPRLRASIVVPYEDPETSADEIRHWAGDRRFVQVLLL